MFSIKKNLDNVFIIKKSKFIGKVFFINCKEEGINILNNIRSKYSDATHICYCYIVDNIIKFSDDNEPSNTAGMPIYNVLKNNNLNHVLAVVIRYFGGIKLGAGGLVRAYSNCISELIKGNIIELKEGYRIKINCNYDKTKDIEYLLKNTNIVEKDFNELISITFDIDKNKFKNLENEIKKYCESLEIINNIYIN